MVIPPLKSGISTSFVSSSLATGSPTTSLPNGNGYWWHGIWISGGSNQTGTINSTAGGSTSTLDRLVTSSSRLSSSPLTLANPSVTKNATNHEPDNVISSTVHSVYPLQSSTSKKNPTTASIPQISVSSTSPASTASVSIFAVSASKISLKKASTENQPSSSTKKNNEAIVSTTTSAIPESSWPTPMPSLVIIVYRRDLCVSNCINTECSSTANEYDIKPGQSVEICDGRANYQAPNYAQKYPQDEAGVTSNYSIDIGPFTTHHHRDCWYNSTYQVLGKLDCPLFIAPCSIPTATVVKCDLATGTPILYAEW